MVSRKTDRELSAEEVIKGYQRKKLRWSCQQKKWQQKKDRTFLAKSRRKNQINILQNILFETVKVTQGIIWPAKGKK